ncbi:retrovirus-related Pol polyprotein from transposon opus [Trichonephila clavipes]|nr:retrovirus-related Pol polyprotein from transposon opus [Trichonephila clavipes]
MYKNALKEDLIRVVQELDGIVEKSENFNLFFQSLERAFLTKKINDEYKSEILINLLGERAHNVLLYIKEEELNDYEKLKSIVLREFQLTPRECLNSFKNAVKSSGETYIQFAARLTANFQYYCSLRKVNSFESLCDLIISDKLFETLNKETATHIGIREAEDWFRPIDLAKECDIFISSRSGSRKEIPITYGYTQDPFKNRSQNFKPNQRLKRTIPNILKEKIKFALYAVIHLIAQETSEKQNSEECANLQYVNIFVENQPVTALIDSGCQIPVLNSSLIRVQTPSEKIITLSSCFGEQRMVEVKPINISLDQHSPVLCKKANGAMKTSSVEFISRSPNPLPMKSKHRRFVLLQRIFQPWQWKRRKKRNRFEQTSRTLQRKISMPSTKDQLVKKVVFMPVKHNVFLWNLPDVEEVPSHDGETV